ncbi:Kiwa anti-phage protein KwaB-like domain-containing protein [Anaerosalibacter sp. Marseille-P3206]|uniref:Kiwa anti-phage protein KwaB-like domain-containing protein n=1 Tax=Anaerosalibacter sp. Marseille-P3206 TaxID=1871005 RepID=UPI000984D0EF|nr:Kiwa anti-phage protein KwaB-like domain-containing protein [Anaerosalibacter sp. Marseille-P3206]
MFKIENFDLSNEISEAINNPLGVEKLIASNSKELNIRAIFLPVQENEAEEKIIFQRIQKRQILLGNQFTLFWDNDTFISTKKPGIVITDSIDAYYEEGTLYFKSYYWANQIFNLNKYYREATDEDIKEFCSFNCFYVKDLETVIPASNNWTRRKIAYILDSKVLENNSTDYIVEAAKNLGVELDINEDSKIVFPEDTTKQRELLFYLADEIYKGSLTEDVYLTNSKRILR